MCAQAGPSRAFSGGERAEHGLARLGDTGGHRAVLGGVGRLLVLVEQVLHEATEREAAGQVVAVQRVAREQQALA